MAKMKYKVGSHFLMDEDGYKTLYKITHVRAEYYYILILESNDPFHENQEPEFHIKKDGYFIRNSKYLPDYEKKQRQDKEIDAWLK